MSSSNVDVPSTTPEMIKRAIEKGATIIDGKAVAADLRKEIRFEVQSIAEQLKVKTPPGIAVIIVGTRQDSQTYVRLKHEAALECGFGSFQVDLPEDVTESVIEDHIDKLNVDPAVHGIIVQLPLPPHINAAKVLDHISPLKDVDGLHPVNVGLLFTKGRDPFFLPCTPMGVMTLLKRSGVTVAGARAVVIGRSNVVGLPVSQLLMQAEATVSVCHHLTVNPEELVRTADIVVAACGQPGLVRGSWIKPGATVIDVGTSPINDPSKKSGYRLVGDVNFEEVAPIASRITPVPGGVGPMTIASLLSNTLLSYKRNLKLLVKGF